ncbi:MAG TPA: ABC transporter substrate-binding protein [Caulobacteraceae bacterium]|nr:ABC transporter substrate-binding protein [Caulobacteraceae bacterium]
MKAIGRRHVMAGVLGLAALAGVRAAAAPADPALLRIAALDEVLLEVMAAAEALGAQGRYRRLAPVLHALFDLPTMTQFTAGPAWNGFTPAQRQQAIAAFGRLLVAVYVRKFDHRVGERFTLDDVERRGEDKIVRTRLLRADASPILLSYRMRERAGDWKVIDVYYGPISQMLMRRADFAVPVAAGGAAGLIAHMDGLSRALLE